MCNEINLPHQAKTLFDANAESDVMVSLGNTELIKDGNRRLCFTETLHMAVIKFAGLNKPPSTGLSGTRCSKISEGSKGNKNKNCTMITLKMPNTTALSSAGYF